MPIYHKLGKIPHKRHTVFKKKDGSLHYEQLFGTIGFDGMSSLMYHLYRPTMVKEVGETLDIAPRPAVAYNMKSRLLKGFEVNPKDDFLDSRQVVLFNSSVHFHLQADITANVLAIRQYDKNRSPLLFALSSPPHDRPTLRRAHRHRKRSNDRIANRY